MSQEIFFKVLHPDLTSGGVFNSKPVQYKLRRWVADPRPLTDEPLRGGLFVLNKLSSVRVLTKKRPKARVFRCRIGKVIRRTRYLTKTDRVKLTSEVK